MGTDPVVVALRACADKLVEVQRAEAREWNYGPLQERFMRDDDAFGRAVDAVAADATIAACISQRIEHSGGGFGPLSAREAVRGFLYGLHWLPDFSYEPVWYEIWLREALDLMRDGHVTAHVIAYIERLHCETLPATIGPFTLRAANAHDPTLNDSGRTYLVLERRLRAPKRSDANPGAGEAFDLSMTNEVREVVDLIKLVTNTAFAVPRVSITTRYLGGEGGSSRMLAPLGPSLGGTLSEADIATVNGLRERLASAKTPVKRALKRFGKSRSEFDPDDRVLDLMTAAEAIFLANEKTESSYRLSLRGAFFIERDPQKRKRLYKVFRSAYDVRSSVAHGGDPAPKDRVDLDGARNVPPHRFASLVDELIVKGLRRAIEDGLPESADWDDLIISPGT